MPANIFDLSDTSDLPEELRPKRRLPQGDGKWNRIFEQSTGQFTVQQARAAHYRMTGMDMNDKAVGSAIHHAILTGQLRRVSRGVFEVIRKPAAKAAE